VTQAPHVEHDEVVEKLRRTPERYDEIRELWKKHSIAEDARDLPGLISTLTDDCVYELRPWGAAGAPVFRPGVAGFAADAPSHAERWEGHEGATRFYTELLTAFPDIHFDLTDIVIGPQGVCEEARVTGTHRAAWLGHDATGERLTWNVVIFFPWDEERGLFRGEKVYADMFSSGSPASG
jgi:predicted ester cyclase